MKKCKAQSGEIKWKCKICYYDIMIYTHLGCTLRKLYSFFSRWGLSGYTKHHPPAMPIGDHQNSHKAWAKGKLLADGWQPWNLSNFNFHETHLRTTKGWSYVAICHVPSDSEMFIVTEPSWGWSGFLEVSCEKKIMDFFLPNTTCVET